ncbi:MAG: hypothetical protein V1839_04205 [archaeon]
MKKLFLFAAFALLIVFVLAVAGNHTVQAASANNVKACESDSDCVPAQCCHATSAVNKLYAPDCSDAVCSIECVPKTLDCGQGTVKCTNGGICVVRLYK